MNHPLLGALRPSFLRRAVLTSVAAAAVLTTGACLDSSTDPSGPRGQVKFINANPLTAYNLADLYISGAQIASAVPYVTIPPNTIGIANVTPDASTQPLLARRSNDTTTYALGTLHVGVDTSYNVFQVQSGASGSQLYVIPDTVQFPAVGSMKYQFVHLAPSEPFVDVYVLPTSDTALAGKSPVATNVPYLGKIPYATLSSDTATVNKRSIIVTRPGTAVKLLTVTDIHRDSQLVYMLLFVDPAESDVSGLKKGLYLQAY